MKQFLLFLTLAVLVAFAGCTKEPPVSTRANVPPKTFLWLFPDSTIAEGQSRQHIRWWGEDPDGVVKGFLVVGGKFTGTIGAGTVLDTIAWRWKTGNDSIVPFPLLTKRDTFNIEVRAVDNTFRSAPDDQALIRFAPTSGSTSAPFWDKNENGVFDGDDMLLPTLTGAMDPTGASLAMPLLNQPPTVVFAQNPNDPSVQMQQPETTYTAATFSWIGSDPDGDQTIASYEIALNDTSDHTNVVSIPGNITVISLVAPRSRTDGITGVQAVPADLWSGTFAATRRNLGLIPNLRLDTLNVFYLRARDIAGDESPWIRMPDPTRRWFVKRPKSSLLIISDYILADKTKSIQFYRSAFAQVGFANPELLDIGRGLTAQQKRNSKLGALVPPFLDPAFIYTLELFDLVYWFTDPFPSLAVAQFPLYQYVRDPSHRGKVIFSTMFETATDPRGALTDFAPIDSVSTVYLSNARFLPTLGETKMPVGFNLIPDSSDAGNYYPPLVFGNPQLTLPGQTIFSLYMRPIYRRADAKYLYHMQQDTRYPASYTYVATLNDLRSVTSQGGTVLACGGSGTIARTTDGGTNWKIVSSGVGQTLEAVRMIDDQNGIIVGDAGTILRTSDGGATWTNQSVVTPENLLDVTLAGSQIFVTGTHGLLIRSTNNGATWGALNLNTTTSLRAIRFGDASTGILAGDGGLILKTTDGGSSWRAVLSLTSATLNGVTFATPTLAFAVGTSGTILRSTNAGESWSQPGAPDNLTELHSVSFSDASTGIAVGSNGAIWMTADGGQTWGAWPPPPLPPVSTPISTQIFGSVIAPDATNRWIVATGGVILRSSDAGVSWSFQPQGNLNVGVIDGVGTDGKRSFVFLGLPLHYLDGPSGPPGTVVPFLQHVLQQEFGF